MAVCLENRDKCGMETTLNVSSSKIGRRQILKFIDKKKNGYKLNRISRILKIIVDDTLNQNGIGFCDVFKNNTCLFRTLF